MTSPTSASYSQKTATFLINCVCLAYGLYKNNVPWILQLPSSYDKYQPPKGYRQVAAIETKNDLGVPEGYWGFSIENDAHNVIAIRGTEGLWEWLADADFSQIQYPGQGWPEGAKVDKGFYHVFTEYELLKGLSLRKSIETAYRAFSKPSLPLLIAGHSLGGPLVLLAAADLAAMSGGPAPGNLEIFTYAGPRLGNPAFATYFEKLFPDTYQVVNLADVAPIYPPSQISEDSYQSIGQEWSYLFQTDEIAGNHAHDTNYAVAMAAVPTVVQDVQPPTTAPIACPPIQD